MTKKQTAPRPAATHKIVTKQVALERKRGHGTITPKRQR